MTVAAWARAPENQPPDLLPAAPEPNLPHGWEVAGSTCEDPTCQCRVSEAGARTLCAMAGVDWAGLNEHQRQHYAAIAGEVFAAMSEALIASGIVTVADEDVDDPEAVEE